MAKLSYLMVDAMADILLQIDTSDYSTNSKLELFSIHVRLPQGDEDKDVYYIGEIYLNKDSCYEISFVPTSAGKFEGEIKHPFRTLRSNESEDFIVTVSSALRIRETRLKKGFKDNIELSGDPMVMSLNHWKVK